jgi:branched-subunit amino acid transport protein
VRPEILGLIAGMAVVTYATRALPLLMPGIERLPAPALAYLRLVGPAVLAALVASNVLIARTPDGSTQVHVGIEWLAIAACVGLVAWRRVLLLGLVAAVAIVAVGRAAGLG